MSLRSRFFTKYELFDLTKELKYYGYDDLYDTLYEYMVYICRSNYLINIFSTVQMLELENITEIEMLCGDCVCD